jgi:hypothetical protein
MWKMIENSFVVSEASIINVSKLAGAKAEKGLASGNPGIPFDASATHNIREPA